MWRISCNVGTHFNMQLLSCFPLENPCRLHKIIIGLLLGNIASHSRKLSGKSKIRLFNIPTTINFQSEEFLSDKSYSTPTTNVIHKKTKIYIL